MSFDLLIRGATVVGPGGPERLDVGSADGLIAALGPELAGPATEELDAAGLHLLPGVLDAHVHFNEPGRTDWEGFDTGTRALAAGGATAAIDMPLNAHPPTVTPLPGKGRLEPGPTPTWRWSTWPPHTSWRPGTSTTAIATAPSLAVP